MINSQVILDRLEEMDENLNLLSELREIDLHKFQNEPKIYKLAERCLEISIGLSRNQNGAGKRRPQ